ncbi:ATP-binding protein [Carnobacterium sp. FSL W8-0810]|uniref:ATP-binding protein n=1 Tax=Carnobacterium sp. FSL W8-0810 TaxID=2954705 RepID=UPI0030FBF867
MQLKKLHLENFRGYKYCDIDFSKDINLIIGKNDVGKSTIMDALEIFFNGEDRDALVKADVGDCNVYADERKMSITTYFELNNSEVVYMDSSHSTDLRSEYLLNKDGLLEIKKEWNCSGSTLIGSSLKVYINCFYPSISEKPYILLKRKELQKEIEVIEEDVNKNINSNMRRALFKHFVVKDTVFAEQSIEIKKLETETDEKDVWGKLKSNLPLFFLFQSDRTNSDTDSEVQNPMKIATKKALSEIEEKLEEIKKYVESTVSEIGKETIEKLKDFDENIAKDLDTNMKLKNWDSLFSFDLNSDNGIPMNKRGSGVRRLILLSYFRAEAERVSSRLSRKNIIYAIEEPETSQHPDYQKMILDSFNTIAEDEKHQVFVTTHTPEIAKLVNPSNTIFIKKENEEPLIVIDEEIKIKEISETLGILPTVSSRVVICVEGKHDVNFLRTINQHVPEMKNIIDFEEENINIIPLSGSRLIDWINKDYLEDSNIIEYHLYDSDVQKYGETVREMNEKNDGRRFGVITNFFEMENYLHPKVINSIFPDANLEMEKFIEEWPSKDIPKYLLDKVMLHIQKTDERENGIKGMLNKRASKMMTKELLEDLGCYEEIESWFMDISQLYSQGSLRKNVENKVQYLV